MRVSRRFPSLARSKLLGLKLFRDLHENRVHLLSAASGFPPPETRNLQSQFSHPNRALEEPRLRDRRGTTAAPACPAAERFELDELHASFQEHMQCGNRVKTRRSTGIENASTKQDRSSRPRNPDTAARTERI